MGTPPRPAPPPAPYARPDAARPSPAAALRRRPWIPILAVVVVAGIVLAIVLTGSSDKNKAPAAKPERLSGTLHGALLNRTPASITFAGEANQAPGGNGQFEGTLNILGDPSYGRPVPMVATATERFDKGRLDLRFTGTLQCLSRDCAKRIVKGVGGVTHGTQGFAGATGRLTIFAHADSATNGDFAIKGSIRY